MKHHKKDEKQNFIRYTFKYCLEKKSSRHRIYTKCKFNFVTKELCAAYRVTKYFLIYYQINVYPACALSLYLIYKITELAELSNKTFNPCARMSRKTIRKYSMLILLYNIYITEFVRRRDEDGSLNLRGNVFQKPHQPHRRCCCKRLAGALHMR